MELKEIDMFQGLNDAELKAFRKIITEYDCKEKEILCKEGDPGDKMFIVLSGAVEIKKKMAENQAISLARLLPGEVFGELSMFDDTQRSATVQALTSAKVLIINKKDFLDLLQSDAKLGLKITIWLVNKTSKRLRKANEIIRDLTTNLFQL
jgi:CRP/FNR family transcriptional regulator, cyclic AMP receptor protein